jgi:hypothetical protein
MLADLRDVVVGVGRHDAVDSEEAFAKLTDVAHP